MVTANAGSTVKVDFVGLLDGNVFATSVKSYAKDYGVYDKAIDYIPLVFRVGDGAVIKGFENAVVGMMPGEEKTIAVQPEEGYGHYRKDLVRRYPRALFEHTGIKLEQGMVLKINTSKGKLRGIVAALDENDALIDLNHEFAGKMLIFKIIMKELL